MIDQWLQGFSEIIVSSYWVAPLMALLAGVLTSLTPCALSSVPLVVGYVGSSVDNNQPNKAFRLSVVFAVGMSIAYTTLGVIASLAGRLMGMGNSWWYIILGVLMILMALQIWEVYNFIPSSYLISRNTKKGYLGALLAGILGGIFSSPCATPVLIVLLGIIAKRGNIYWGILLLLLYSIGHSFFVIIAGTTTGFVKTLTSNKRYGIFSKALKLILGGFVLCIAFYMLYLGF